jgi:dTDP-4-dehydrorhamnose reductase
MRPVLVAGKEGQLARCLVEQAAERGMPLVAIGRPKLDLTKPETVDEVVRAIVPSAIVNAAAYTAVDKAESEPRSAFAVNRDGAAQLGLQADRRNVPFIHISTDYVFDGKKPAPYNEEDPTGPLNTYGRSKLDGERAVREVCPAALIFRTSWVYSPHGSNFIKTMLRLGQTRDPIRVVDDQRGTPTAATDLAGAIVDLISRFTAEDIRRLAGVYHLTARGDTTWHGFASAIFSGSRRRDRRVPDLVPITTAQYPTPARRPANSRLDCTKAAQQLGIQLPHWQQSVETCLVRLFAQPEFGPC